MASSQASEAEDVPDLDPNEDVTELERELGLGFYLTHGPGIGGKLRQTPDDFRVQEDSAPVAKAREGGKYTLARIEARNWETNRLIREIANRLSIPHRSIYFTGTKDKRAVTVQNLAIAAPEKKVSELSISDVSVLETYRVDRAPKIGEHSGNAFIIRIRGSSIAPEEVEERVRSIRETILEEGGFPNFFGPQRFGSVHPITHLVGEEIVAGRIEEAVWTYIAYPTGHDRERLDSMREELWDSRDVEEAIERLPSRFDNEHEMLKHLSRRPDDYAGALKQLPLNLTRLFVSAHQSHLFNKALTERARRGNPNRPEVGDILHPVDENGLPDADRPIPVRERNLERCREAARKGQGLPTAGLPGYKYGQRSVDGLQREIEREILEGAGRSPDDFRVAELPKLSSSGTRRAMWCPIDHLPVEHAEDEHGAYTELEFFLPKGSYATCLLREFMKTDLAAY